MSDGEHGAVLELSAKHGLDECVCLRIHTWSGFILNEQEMWVVNVWQGERVTIPGQWFWISLAKREPYIRVASLLWISQHMCSIVDSGERVKRNCQSCKKIRPNSNEEDVYATVCAYPCWSCCHWDECGAPVLHLQAHNHLRIHPAREDREQQSAERRQQEGSVTYSACWQALQVARSWVPPRYPHQSTCDRGQGCSWSCLCTHTDYIIRPFLVQQYWTTFNTGYSRVYIPEKRTGNCGMIEILDLSACKSIAAMF